MNTSLCGLTPSDARCTGERICPAGHHSSLCQESPRYSMLITHVACACTGLTISAFQLPRIQSEYTQGVVTHCTDVKPMVAVATYLDINSGIEMFQEVAGPLFTPVDKGIKDLNPRGEPTMQIRGSKLLKFQQIKIQEMSDEVPSSATPRCVLPRFDLAASRCTDRHAPRWRSSHVDNGWHMCHQAYPMCDTEQIIRDKNEPCLSRAGRCNSRPDVWRCACICIAVGTLRTQQAVS